MAKAASVTEANDRWVQSEIRRLDQRIDAADKAAEKALAALGTGADKAAASRALAFSIIASVVSILGIAIAIVAVLHR